MKRLGGAIAIAVLGSLLVMVSSAGAFQVNDFKVAMKASNGVEETQAGAHPFELETSFSLPYVAVPGPTEYELEELRDVFVSQVPGLVGDVTAIPMCSAEDFASSPPGELELTECSDDAAVGYVEPELGTPVSAGNFALYNLEPELGYVAEFGFTIAAGARIKIGLRISETAPYRVEAIVREVPQPVKLFASSIHLWGVPADPLHDSLRGKCAASKSGETCPINAPLRPFLTLPRSCIGPQATELAADSWPVPGRQFDGRPDLSDPAWATASQLTNTGGTPFTASGFTGCSRLGLVAADTRVTPSSVAGESPSGLSFDLDVGTGGLTNTTGLAGSDVKKVEVTLPEGIVANASLAEGLVACSVADLQRETFSSSPSAGCPNASKVGTVEVETPLLSQPIAGSLYVAKPYENLAGNSLLGIYMVLKDSDLGISIKQPISVVPDAKTGRLVATAENLPQLPFSHFKLRFREGQRAPLTTPANCGSYSARAVLTPWSGGAPTISSSSFAVTVGASGSTCNPSAFAPTFEAGTVSPVAGLHSPFVLNLKRNAGSPQFSSVEATLPEGALAQLAGVSQCTDAEIAAARAREAPLAGSIELGSPSCPANSRVGTVTVGAGSGALTYVQGSAYLGGPYKGAPLSLVIITPAVSGPFDLGSVIVRNALYVNPLTTRVRAVSDPIPSILQGIPLNLRSISIDLARPEFTLNPTSCDPMAVTGTVTALTGARAPVQNRFQVGGCKGLAFKPSLKLFLSGKTRRGGNPALKAVLTQPRGQNANIAGATVVLPSGIFIDNSHINSPCTRVQFTAGAVPGERCPPKSVLGRAKVWTPLLDRPEQGKVYFRSNGGDRELPDLVIALRGQIPIELVGFIDSVGRKGAEVSRVRTRFQNVPDAPVSRFELNLFGGGRGLLQNSRNLCKSGQNATIKLTGHNAKSYDTSSVAGIACRNQDNRPKK